MESLQLVCLLSIQRKTQISANLMNDFCFFGLQLRQVVRICTKTDLSKRASAIEVCDKLEAKLQTVQVLSPTSDNSQHPPLEPKQLTVQVDHHSFS